MSSGLRIVFGYYASDTGQVLAPIEVIDAKQHRVYRGHLSLDVSKPTDVDVPPGSYLVRAKLPSGEVASDQVVVTADNIATVTLEPPTRSARESLGWAYYLKQTPERAGTSRSTFANTPPALHQHRVRPDVLLWRYRGNGDWDKLVQNPLTGWMQPYQIDSLAIDESVVFQDPQAVMAINIESHLGSRFNLGQCWIQVRLGKHSQFLALPPAERIRVLIMHRDQEDAQDRPLDVIADGNNPRAEALLGYITTGAFESARSVSDTVIADAEALLHDKTKDVSGAAIAGYFLLKAGKAEHRGAWTHNLCDWFPWLPDGAVIDGWRRLRAASPERAEARNRFVDAATRGIPLFTYGLRLLFDGLMLCSANPDLATPEVSRALAFVQPYAAAADWAASNTTHFGTLPNDPQPAS